MISILLSNLNELHTYLSIQKLYNLVIHDVLTDFSAILIIGFVCTILLLLITYKLFIQKKKENELLLQSNAKLVEKIRQLEEMNQLSMLAEQKLKNNNATKDKFFSIISHDLKGPLNSLTGLLQILIKYADSFSKEELKDFGKNMNKSVNNLLDLLENLFHWSQTQSGTIQYSPDHISLYEIVQKTVNLLEPSAKNKNIIISVDVNEKVIVLADSNMISFALRNLVSNAVKFTNNGGQIRISSLIKSEMIELSVADNGIGMGQQDIEKLFRIDKCHTTNGTANEMGTGLGLILSNEFIDKNGGVLTVESELNKGSVFRFTVPVVSTLASYPVSIN